MATIANLLVRIGADITELTKALDQSKGQLGLFTAETEAASFSVARLALTAGTAGAAILGFLGGAVRAAAAARESQALLANAIRATGNEAAFSAKRLEDQVDALTRLTGEADVTIREIQRLLVSFGATQKQIEALVPRILNYAAATGKDASFATFLFGRALAGAEGALTRILGPLGEGVSLVQDFDRVIALLDRRFGGAAETAGQQLAKSLNALRVALGNLFEALGAPALDRITQFVRGLTDVVRTIADFAKANPFIVKLLVSVAALAGTGLTLTGVFLGLRAIAARVVPAINLLTTAIIGQQFAMAGLSSATKAHIALLTLLRTPLGQVGILLTAVTFGLVLYANQMEKAVRAEREFGKPKPKLIADIERQSQALEVLRRQTEDAAAANKLLATQEALRASEVARQKLQKPGLLPEQVQKIEDERLRIVQAARDEELRLNIKALTAELTNVRIRKNAGLATERDLVAAEQRLTDAYTELSNLRLSVELDNQKRRADAIKALADLRIQVEVEGARREADLIAARGDAARTALQEEADLQEASTQRRLAQITLETDFRLAALRRTVDLEKQLQGDILDAREAIAKTAILRLEVEEIKAASRRADLLRRGLITEEDAAKEAEAARRRQLERRFQVELEFAERRVAQVQKELEMETIVVAAMSDAKLKQLDAEVAAQRAGIETRVTLREKELTLAIEIMRAETLARKAELKAQLDAQLALVRAQAIAARSPEERRARLEALDELTANQKRALDALDQSLVIRENATVQTIKNVQAGGLAELTALQQSAAAKRTAIEQEAAATIAGLESASVAKRAAALEKLADVRLRLTQSIADEEEALRQKVEAGEITQAEADRRIKSLKVLADTLDRLVAQEEFDVDRSLGPIEKWRTAVSDRLAAIKPLLDALREGVGELFAARPGGGGPQPAAVAVAAGAGAVNNIFTFQGTTFTLTADESAILERVVAALLGPEGNRLVASWFKRQPGNR